MLKAAKYFMVGVVALLGSHAARCLANEVAASSGNDARAIYGAFLSQWQGKGDALTNVANTATLPTPKDIEQYDECAGSGKGSNVHWTTDTTDADLNHALASVSRINLVDPKSWKATDPGQLIAKGQSVDSAVRAGMSNGLMTLSAISFNEAHDTAIFTFSFVCGGLCGHGGTVIFKKTPKGWVQSEDDCGSWIS